jgi:hypothetical protein
MRIDRITATTGMCKNLNARITKMLEKRSKVKESNQKYLLKKLLQDIDNLKFYSDKEYRNKIESAARKKD